MILEIIQDSLKITAAVFVLLSIIEYIELKWRREIERVLTRNSWMQIVFSALLGLIPGCVDAFFVFSLYSYGLVGFGALTAVLLSTAGDEAFVMLALVPDAVPLIFVTCLIAGIVGGFIADALERKVRLRTSKPCEIEFHAEEELEAKHFLKEHVYRHILKDHIWKLFCWLFFTMLAIQYLVKHFDLAAFLPQNKIFLLILAILIGMIPESGPHLAFVMLFKEGLIPLSVLVANTIVQDGHGSLPLLSYSLRDMFNVSIYTGVIGLIVGLVFIAIGL